MDLGFGFGILGFGFGVLSFGFCVVGVLRWGAVSGHLAPPVGLSKVQSFQMDPPQLAPQLPVALRSRGAHSSLTATLQLAHSSPQLTEPTALPTAPPFLILGFGLWALDFGFWVLDFGFWILGCGFCVVKRSNPD